MPDTFTDTDVALAEDSTAPVPGEETEAADAAFDLILLDPTLVTLFRTGGSTVRATIADPQIGAERSYLRVQIARAFPLSDPDHYIGLRDEKDKDIGMLPSLAGLDADSRRIVDEELHRRYFLPVIQHVVSVKEEYGTITFDVETDKGRRLFYVQNIRESVQDLPPHRLLITDRDGNRYEFPDTTLLTGKTYTVLQRVL
jgi:hypothetical protein